MSHTAVRVPVREAETIVRRRALANGDPLQPQDGSLMAHITVLSPFVAEDQLDDGVIAELERYFADEGQFGYELTGVSRFPGEGPAYLVPEPGSLFRELTQGLCRIFRQFPPYGGRFDDLVPHLSVPLLAGETVDDLRADVEHRLPLEATAFTATLVRVAEHDTRTIASFPFGSTAA
ncbi:2'-5' RNA ligase family protein [Nocardioides mangrovicus]|uniref:2'-5' RNA ligase family protein n=1 Tax=Nocardioides mangrovicus TaxID=2478913 RepID=UPI001314778B|nr:2'-5' RNA ligase family protein [Nocardioides mangrovicus]